MWGFRVVWPLSPDGRAGIVANDRVAVPFRWPLESAADVAERGAGANLADALPRRFLRAAHEPPRGGRDGADQIGLARIGDEAVLFERDVEVDDVAVPDDRAGVGHAVANDMVDRAEIGRAHV